MEISSKSWHMRLVRAGPEGADYAPKTLCTHFWMVVATLTAFVFIAIGAVVLWLWEHRPRRSKAEPKPKEPSLVLEYLKARKQRICPIITVREE